MKAVIPGSVVKQRLSLSSALEIVFKKVQNWSFQKFLHCGGAGDCVVVVVAVNSVGAKQEARPLWCCRKNFFKSSLEQQLQWVQSKLVRSITVLSFSHFIDGGVWGQLERNHDDSFIKFGNSCLNSVRGLGLVFDGFPSFSVDQNELGMTFITWNS